MTQKRLHYLDIAKGIGIILVVTGHSGMGSEGLLSWLSSFHMPLFFVISGMLLFHRKEESLPLMESIRKKAKSILIPYSFFSLIYLVIDLYYIAIKHQELSLPDAALQTISFYGISVLWFLPTLFAGEVLFLLIRKKATTSSPLFYAVRCALRESSVQISMPPAIIRHPVCSFLSGLGT